MDPMVEGLINNCVHLQHEIDLLIPIVISLSPSSNKREIMEANIPKLGRLEIREKLKQLKNPVKIKAEYTSRIKELENILADLAEILEEEEFEIDRFRFLLSEDQFDWLTSHQGEIKKYLRGIELGKRGEKEDRERRETLNPLRIPS
jgi:hypothetical protein